MFSVHSTLPLTVDLSRHIEPCGSGVILSHWLKWFYPGSVMGTSHPSLGPVESTQVN